MADEEQQQHHPHPHRPGHVKLAAFWPLAPVLWLPRSANKRRFLAPFQKLSYYIRIAAKYGTALAVAYNGTRTGSGF